MPKPAICHKCRSTKVVKSRPRGLDRVWIALVPLRPYRCLHCYHRFWKYTPLFADTSRCIFWLLLLAYAAYCMFSAWQFSSNQALNTPAVNELVLQNTYYAVQTEKMSRSEQSMSNQHKPQPVITDLQSDLPQAEIKQPAIEAVGQQQVANLEKQQQTEQQSVLKVEINHMIEAWRQAWQRGDSKRYLTFYSEIFEPSNKLSYVSWNLIRSSRVRPGKGIKITLLNFAVTFNQNNKQATVVFDQYYQSFVYTDTVRKQLSLVKQGQDWKIAAEQVIGKQP